MHAQLSPEKNISHCMEGFFKKLGPVPNYPTHSLKNQVSISFFCEKKRKKSTPEQEVKRNLAT